MLEGSSLRHSQLYLRHPAWLWIKKHAKHLLPPVDPALQSLFDEGHAFEPFAEALVPDLVRLGFSDFATYQSLTGRTLDAWRDGAAAVAQGRYEAGQLTCISDIVTRDDSGYILTEIKSGTKAKPVKRTAIMGRRNGCDIAQL